MIDQAHSELWRMLGWRELALRYLDGYNPQPDKAIVVANCIVDFDGYISSDQPLRYHAHRFTTTAVEIIDRMIDRGSEDHVTRWIRDWNSTFGVPSSLKPKEKGDQ